MDKKKSGLWAYIKDILGYLFMTFFSACLAIAMINEEASIGFILFACAAAFVGIYMSIITVKKAATKDHYEPEAAYEPGPWLREFDKAQAGFCGVMFTLEKPTFNPLILLIPPCFILYSTFILKHRYFLGVELLLKSF